MNSSVPSAGAESWQALAAVVPPAPPDRHQSWRERRRLCRGPQPALEVNAVGEFLEEIVPKPPRWASTGLLVAFFLAAVPLDGWLTRRSLRRGARSRFGALRYPAMVVLAVAAAFVITEGATGRDMSVIRCDVIDIGPEQGALHGQTITFLARGRSGRMTIGAPGSALSVSGFERWNAMPAARLFPAGDGAPRIEAAVLDVDPWEVIRIQARWLPESMPEGIVAPERLSDPPRVPACIAAQVRGPWEHDVHVTSLFGEIPAGPFDANGFFGGLGEEAGNVSHLLGQATSLPMPDGEACDLAVVQRGASGPELRIDGARLRPDKAYTILRLRYPEAVRPSRAEVTE